MRVLITGMLFTGLVCGLLGEGSAADGVQIVPDSALAFQVETPAKELDAGDGLTDDVRLANELLEGLQDRYRYLDGVTVDVDVTPNGEQAVAYYRQGRIVISPARQVSVEKILAHEIWHVIDWRDNGRIDWYENVPPADWKDYLRE